MNALKSNTYDLIFTQKIFTWKPPFTMFEYK